MKKKQKKNNWKVQFSCVCLNEKFGTKITGVTMPKGSGYTRIQTVPVFLFTNYGNS